MDNLQQLLEQLDKNEVDVELFRRDFRSFAKFAWTKEFPTKVLQWSWHHDCICDHLQAIGDNEARHTYFVVPPRHTKSTFISHFFQPWIWLKRPATEFISCAHTADKAKDDAGISLALMQAPWYLSLIEGLPEHLQWKLTKLGTDRIRNSMRGQRRTLGTGGRPQGDNADYILLDDVLDRSDITSPANMLKLRLWWMDSISTRLNDPNESAFIIINQRLSEYDLIGLLRETENLDEWNRVVLPALYERHHPDPFYSTVINKDTGEIWKDKRTQNGEILFPQRWGMKALQDMKRKKTKKQWNSEYLARPSAEDGDVFKKEWFTFISQTDFDTLEEEYTIQSWDTAFTDVKLKLKDQGERASYSACTTWSIMYPKDDPKDRYIVLRDLWMEQVGYSDLKANVIALNDEWNPKIIVMEKESSARSIFTDYDDRLQLPLVPFEPRRYGSKRVRAESASDLVEGGRVLVPDWLKSLEMVVECCSNYPSKGQDVVDTVSQALLYVRDNDEMIIRGDAKNENMNEDFYLEVHKKDTDGYMQENHDPYMF